MKRIKMNAPVTIIFVFICFVATILGMVSGGLITKNFFMTYHSGLANPMTYVRFITHVFGHGSWSHFMSNATYLLLLGPLLEEKYGSKTLVEIMVLTAVITGLVNYFLFPNTGLCGASGVVFAFILLSSFVGFKKGEIPLTFILVAVVFLGQQVYEGLFVVNNISNMAHIVGGLLGTFAGMVLGAN